MVAGTDQARHSANQIPASKFPLPPPPQPAGPTIPPCDQAGGDGHGLQPRTLELVWRTTHSHVSIFAFRTSILMTAIVLQSI